MKRRGFLGLIGGATIAGPAVAKNALSAAAPTLSGNLGAGSLAVGLTSDQYGTSESVGIGSMLKKLDRAAQIKRWISGEEEPEEDIYDQTRVRQLVTEQHVNSLNSVSASAKLRIMRRKMTILEREKMKKYWWKELLQLESADG